MAKRINPGRIKLHRNYTVEEAAKLLGCCRGTVRRWIKGGLPIIADQKPVLILGGDLVDFVKARSSATKTRCRPHECYCVKCRAPRGPAGAMAEFVPISASSGNLRALCPVCTTLMHKRVATALLHDLRSILDLTVTQASKHIGESPNPSSNDHEEEDPPSDA